MKIRTLPNLRGLSGCASAYLAVILCLLIRSATAQPGMVERRPIRSYFLSPPEYQLNEALDTLQVYETLYRNERQISSGLKSLVTVEQGRRDRFENARDVAAGERDAARKQRDLAEFQRDQQKARADVAEAALKPITDERNRLKGKTKIGQLLRKARDGLAVIGGAAVAAAVVVIAL